MRAIRAMRVRPLRDWDLMLFPSGCWLHTPNLQMKLDSSRVTMLQPLFAMVRVASGADVLPQPILWCAPDLSLLMESGLGFVAPDVLLDSSRQTATDS